MPKISKPLSTTEVKNYKPESKMYKKPDGKGLWLVIKPNGTKSWRYDFRYGGKNLSMSFGIYPEIGLKEAREKREEARELLSKNINPISEKRIKKASESLTLGNVIDEWIELRKKSASEATVTQNKRMFKNITDWLGNVAIKDVKRANIINVLEKVQNRGTIETAHRLLSLINKVYMYAVTKEYVEHNIIADIDKKAVLIPNKKDSHLPAITEIKDIRQLLQDTNTLSDRFRSDISTVFIFKIIPYVFVRSENIRLMEWDELDLNNDVWDIPKEKMKMNVDFLFPLPKQAVKIIREIEPYSRHRSKYVFPSNIRIDQGISRAVLSDTLKRLGYQNVHSFHGFRSMFSTITNELYKEHGFHSDIIEACLAHKEKNKVRAAYNRESKYKYFEEKKELIQWYADWLDKLVKI
jgi:integrase